MPLTVLNAFSTDTPRAMTITRAFNKSVAVALDHITDNAPALLIGQLTTERVAGKALLPKRASEKTRSAAKASPKTICDRPGRYSDNPSLSCWAIPSSSQRGKYVGGDVTVQTADAHTRV